jgi:hypothetical protein
VYDSNGKNIMERAIQYIKDRTECFDDYFPCNKDDCDNNKKHVINWFKVFTTYLNVRIDLSKFINEYSIMMVVKLTEPRLTHITSLLFLLDECYRRIAYHGASIFSDITASSVLE